MGRSEYLLPRAPSLRRVIVINKHQYPTIVPWVLDLYSSLLDPSLKDGRSGILVEYQERATMTYVPLLLPSLLHLHVVQALSLAHIVPPPMSDETSS